MTNSEAIPNRKVAVVLAAILSTLLEHEAPSGIIYAALMEQTFFEVDYSTYMGLVQFMQDKALVTQTANVLRLTETGKQLAERVDALTGKH